MKSITAETLMDFFKEKSVGIVYSQIGISNYFIETFVIDDFKVSMQIGYYLWSFRCDNRINHTEPMNEREYYYIINDGINTIIDARIIRNGEVILEAGQYSFKFIAETLNDYFHMDYVVKSLEEEKEEIIM